MKTIPLTRGKVALVDDGDYERLVSKKWHCSKLGYAIRFEGRKVAWMHRQIMDPPPGMEVDHINRDRLDNRRENLRIATHAENSRNCSARRNNKSGIPGVGFHKRSGYWRAYVRVNGRQYEKNGFSTQEAAVAARAEMAKEHFGDFAPKTAVIGAHTFYR